MRCEKRDRRVPPVVDESGRAVLRVELENGEQFDSGDAEIAKIWDLFDQARIRAAKFLCDAGTGVSGETADMHFVDDRP